MESLLVLIIFILVILVSIMGIVLMFIVFSSRDNTHINNRFLDLFGYFTREMERTSKNSEETIKEVRGLNDRIQRLADIAKPQQIGEGRTIEDDRYDDE